MLELHLMATLALTPQSQQIFSKPHRDGYPGSYPTVTADILETPSPSVSDSVTTGESQTVEVTPTQTSVSDAVIVTESFGYYSETVFVSESVQVEIAGAGPADRNVSESDGLSPQHKRD
jgi:hypothetical protein